jgi:hypothetical protein
VKIYHRTNIAAYCNNNAAGSSVKGCGAICVEWQGMSIVETRRADKETRNAGDSVAKYQ